MRPLFKLFRAKDVPKAADANRPITATEALLRDNVNQYLRDMLVQANAEIAQLKFLLESAPMIDMLTQDRLAACRAKYAFAHPKSIAPFTWGVPPSRWYKFSGSPTYWIPVSSIPEGRVLFSPWPLPGMKSLVSA